MNKKLNNLSRRDFLKITGGGAAAMTASLYGCSKKNKNGEEGVPIGKMTYRINNNSGDKVSLLGYGMMRLPESDDKELGTRNDNKNVVQSIDQKMVDKEIKFALDHGVNYFDTSPAYCEGLSEESLGKALKASGYARHRYFIATKMSNFSPETQTREASIQMYHNSMKYLKTSYIDYMLLHGIGMGNGTNGIEDFYHRFIDNGILNYLVDEHKAKRIRNLGFSYHGDIKVFDLLLKWMDEGKYHWDFVQIELNYLDWNYANEMNEFNTDAKYLYSELEKRNIPAVIMEPLLGGRLANVPDNIAAEMAARRPNDQPAVWAFRYAGSKARVLTVLSGMTYMQYLIQNICTYSPLQPITSDDDKFLMSVAKEMMGGGTIPCTGCRYCMPCPYGLNIPAIFAHYNKCVNDNALPKDSQNPQYRKFRRAFLIGYDRSVPKLRQAAHCIGCGQCKPHCPQHIDIPAEMNKIDGFVEQLKRDE